MDNSEIPLDLWFRRTNKLKKKDNIKLWKILDILMATMTFY